MSPRWLYWPAAGGGTAWTPAELGSALAGWWDASDPSTLFTEVVGGTHPGNGQGVARWEDKSGSGNHVTQSTLALRPIYRVSAMSSRNAVQFDQQALTAFVDLDTQMATVAAVTDQSAGNARLVDKRGTGVLGSFRGWHLKPHVFEGDGWLIDQGDGNARAVASSVAFAGTNMFVGTSDTLSTLYLNGTDTTSLQTALGNAPTNVNRADIALCFGANSNGQNTQMMNGGHLGEIVIARAVLSTLDRQRLEGYVAHKWNLEDKLPADHPYKNAAPTV